jgi:homopolymeric O-antigen transport system permease protein
MRFFLNPFRLIWKHRVLLTQTVRNDIRQRYAGMALGWIWAVLYPLMLLGVYALVYIFVFKVRVTSANVSLNSIEYVALIFCGLIPFLGFSEALGIGVGSVVGNINLVKNTLFPIELIPVKAVLSAQVTQTVGTGLLLIPLMVMNKLTFLVLLLPFVWFCQILFMIGLIWILSGLNIFFRDIQNIVAILILVLMMLSPIAYTIEMVPEALRPFMGINPLYYFIVTYQGVLMLGRLPPWSVLLAVFLLGILVFSVGFWFFTRLKLVLVDYA